MNIGVGVSNGAMGTTITPMVHDSIIASIFSVSGGLSNILIGVTSFGYNVHIASTNWQKTIFQVPVAGSKD